MMLNGQSGSMSAGTGFAPAGANHTANESFEPSSPMRRAVMRSRTGSSAGVTAASRNNSVAPASAAMVATLAAVDEGASGATAMPARRPPRKTAAYTIEVVAQMAMAS